MNWQQEQNRASPGGGEETHGVEELNGPNQGASRSARDTAALGELSVRVSVIVPTLNEARNLPYVLPNIPRWVDEIILVDGNSQDDTVAVARRLVPDIRVVAQEGRGKGNALRAGFAAATGDVIVMIDADGSTDPREIAAFVGALLAGADLVKGSRFLQGGGTADMTYVRRTGHWFLLQSVRVLFGCNYSDLCYGYKAFWREDVLPQLRLDADGFEIETLIGVRAIRAGLRIAEVPSYEHERIHGLSNLRAFADGWRILKVIVREWAQHRLASPASRPAPGSLFHSLVPPAAPQAPPTMAGWPAGRTEEGRERAVGD